VLQPFAFLRDIGRQRRVVDDRDLGAIKYLGVLIRGDIRVQVDPHLGVARLLQPLENHGQRFIGVDKNSAHGFPLVLDYQDATPASVSTVCISTLAPAAQSACVASSSSLWLMPSLQGTNTIAAGITVLRLQASSRRSPPHPPVWDRNASAACARSDRTGRRPCAAPRSRQLRRANPCPAHP